MPHMYILECADGSFYTGSTVNLEKRLCEHENGLGSNHTSQRLPIKLVYCEEYDRVDDAFYREKQVQGWGRAKKIALIEGNFSKLPELASTLRQAQGSATGYLKGSATGYLKNSPTKILDRCKCT